MHTRAHRLLMFRVSKLECLSVCLLCCAVLRTTTTAVVVVVLIVCHYNRTAAAGSKQRQAPFILHIHSTKALLLQLNYQH
jgi:hypothetical protein